ASRGLAGRPATRARARPGPRARGGTTYRRRGGGSHGSPTSNLRPAHGLASLGGRPAHGCAYCVMSMRTLAAASRRAFDERPLVVILIVGAALRLIAAIFRRGFFTTDYLHL